MGNKKGKSYLAPHVRCPNWQCSGDLYLVENTNLPNGWQMPDIECDDCHTRWKNLLNEANKKENKECDD